MGEPHLEINNYRLSYYLPNINNSLQIISVV